MNTYTLIIVCACSLGLNIMLIGYSIRITHWLRVWQNKYEEAIAPIEPISPNVWDDFWEGDDD